VQILRRDRITIRPDRQRKEFDEKAIQDLATSIERVGLLNPIIVTRDAGSSLIYLVAGERRLRALDLLDTLGTRYRHASATYEASDVPVIHFNDLDELAREEIELEENVAREDLTWQERVAAIARLDTLRKKRDSTHTTSDTAREVFGDPEAAPASVTTTYRALALAKAAASDPEIAGAKSEKEAYKLLTRKEERQRYADLAIASPVQTAEERHRLVHGDCLDWMRAQPASQFQIILTDPPYGMGADTFGDAAGKLQGIEHHYDDSSDATQKLLAAWFPESYRLAAPEAFLFLWCDIDLFPWLKLQAALAGWKPHRTPFINIKREGGRVPWPASGPRRCYELCLYATKGEATSRSIVRDVFESTLGERNYGHGAQKPVEAYEYLLRFVARPGDRALDTFAGTGTLLDAAERVGIASTCVEMDAAHYGIMLERLRALENKNDAEDLFGLGDPAIEFARGDRTESE